MIPVHEFRSKRKGHVGGITTLNTHISELSSFVQQHQASYNWAVLPSPLRRVGEFASENEVDSPEACRCRVNILRSVSECTMLDFPRRRYPIVLLQTALPPTVNHAQIKNNFTVRSTNLSWQG